MYAGRWRAFRLDDARRQAPAFYLRRIGLHGSRRTGLSRQPLCCHLARRLLYSGVLPEPIPERLTADPGALQGSVYSSLRFQGRCLTGKNCLRFSGNPYLFPYRLRASSVGKERRFGRCRKVYRGNRIFQIDKACVVSLLRCKCFYEVFAPFFVSDSLHASPIDGGGNIKFSKNSYFVIRTLQNKIDICKV